jgi:hypothetical protein
MSKMRGGANKKDDGFTVRTVMAMATEMAEARDSMDRACVQFAALAKSIGVPVEFEDIRAK